MTDDEAPDVRTDAASAAAPFHTELQHHDPAIVVAVAGEIDMVSEPALQESIDEALTEQPPLVVVDLSGVSFMGSGGLAALLRARQRAESQHTEVRVVAADRAVTRPIEATGVDQMLGVYDSRDAALQASMAPDKA